MKTTLIALFTAALLGLASRLSGRSFDAADFTAILFATGLVAWTIEQYSCETRVLIAVRPLPFPVSRPRSLDKISAERLAA